MWRVRESDDRYVWVDDNWRVLAPEQRSAVPVQLFLETREHLDMDDLDAVLAAELGQLIVRLDRAIQAVGGIGRVACESVGRWRLALPHVVLRATAR